MLDVEPEEFQIPAQRVERNVAEGVAHVGGGIRSHSADVHLDRLAVGGSEVLNISAEGVI
jgi:hypothetical protein